jgi:hypothetical protein
MKNPLLGRGVPGKKRIVPIHEKGKRRSIAAVMRISVG